MNWVNQLVDKYPQLSVCVPEISKTIEVMMHCFSAGGKLLVCGNGGSAADSEHIVGELMKGYLLKRPLPENIRKQLTTVDPQKGQILAEQLQGALPAISLVSQVSLLSAFANDVSAELSYAQQVYGYGRIGDVLLGISTSGNAQNVIYAMQTAKALGMHTVGLSGFEGGAMKQFCDVMIRVPGKSTPEIQEYHLPVYHTICAALEDAFFG